MPSSLSTLTIGQSCAGVMTCGPWLVAKMVSSLLVPVMEGFHAKGWFSNTTPGAVGEPR